MPASIFSEYWYRVAGLKPRLRAHVRIDRQYQRDQLWYMLEDRSSGRQYRFTPAAHEFLGALDGSRTVQQIWEHVAARRKEEAPTQDEALRILAMLHSLDLMQCDVPPDIDELFGRFQSHQRSLLAQRWSNPLSVRVPLYDPDRLLERMLPLIRLVFSRGGLALWLVVVIAGFFSGAQHWLELSENVVDRVLSPQNLLLLSLLYPCIKLAHEFGHAAATKVWGGEVHDVGVFFVAMIPMPYVDCSSASMFRLTRHRAVVGAAGMMVELFLASLAMFLWLNAETGLLRACAFNVILIAGVSTILVNGNPLLRFDAYYILADLAGIPNLGTRANRYLGYLCQRYLFGVSALPSPVSARGERRWFLCYSVASFFYRIVVSIGLIWFVAGKYLAVGALIAIWAANAQFLLPVLRLLRFLLTSPQLGAQRLRALLVSSSLAAATAFLLFGLPVPLTTEAEGVISLPEGAELRAGTSATVSRVLVEDGAEVAAGDVLIETEDPFLDAEAELYAAQLRQTQAKLGAAVGRRVEMEMLKDDLGRAEAELARVRERGAALQVSAPAAGRVVIPRIQHLEGRFLNQGDLIGYVLGDEPPRVKAVVPQERTALVRTKTQRVTIRTASRPDMPIKVTMRRDAPGATERLPHPALGSLGGGDLPTRPDDKDGLTLLRPVFQFELELPIDAREARIGERVHVRFDHGSESVGTQCYRVIRQLFLGKFEV